MNLLNRDERILKTLRLLSETTEPVGSGRIAAALVYKNKTIGIGTNLHKTHPFQAQYGKNDESIFFHAEVHAIHQALNSSYKNKIPKSTLYVYRVKRKKPNSKDFIVGNSKPCQGCMRCIRDHNIKKVIYTIGPNEYGIIFPKTNKVE